MSFDQSNQNVFQPVKSNGGYYLLIILVIISALLTFLGVRMLLIAGVTVSLLIFGLDIGIVVVFAIFLYGFYGMKYILTNEYLIIKWGFFKKVIPYRTIADIEYPKGRIYQGIREGGANVPGFYLGRFKLMFEGEFWGVSLYATSLSNLLLIKMNNGNYYGISPENGDLFYKRINEGHPQIEEKEIDTNKPLNQSPEVSLRNKRIGLGIFILSLLVSATTLIYFLYIYPQLSGTVPLHFGVNGVPNGYGSKSILIDIQIFYVIFGVGFSILIYEYVVRKRQLVKTMTGVVVMLLPLAINILFLVITIFMLHSVIIYS